MLMRRNPVRSFFSLLFGGFVKRKQTGGQLHLSAIDGFGTLFEQLNKAALTAYRYGITKRKGRIGNERDKVFFDRE